MSSNLPKILTVSQLMKLKSFLLSLSSFDFNILLIIYALIFPFTEYLFNIFQSKSMDILFCSCEVENTITKLEELRTNMFDEIWNVLVSKCGLPTRRKVRYILQQNCSTKHSFLKSLIP